MIINKVRLKNFRSYEDEIEFDFNPDKDKNIILIGGENGAGKSTLFEAMKLCIYGPLAYEYQGFNSTYISKIKSFINHNAFKSDIVDSYIALDITLEENLETNYYTLMRHWTFVNQKLTEAYTINKNNKPLNEEDSVYFENYLRSVIPPKIFEFFFFDGEHLSEFFIGKNSKTHLKESLLSLCNYDIFSMLKKQIQYNQKSNSIDSEELNALKSEIDYLSIIIDEIQSNIESLNSNLVDITNDISNLEVSKSELEKEFRKAGGILAEERETITSSISSLENRRAEINLYIKDFCNDMLPFIILKDKIPTLKEQILLEESYLAFDKVKTRLSPELVSSILNSCLTLEESVTSETSSEIAKSLSGAMFPEFVDNTNFNIIHYLANDDKNTVLSTVNEILSFDSDSVLSSFSEISVINSRISEYRAKLNTSIDNDELNKYIDNMAKISNDSSLRVVEKGKLDVDLENLRLELLTSKSKLDKSKEKYLEYMQSNNIVDISENITSLIDDLIETVTISKISEVQDNFIQVFDRVIRKDKYINYIDITEDFTVTLYITKTFNSSDIQNLLENLGYDEMLRKMGCKFFEELNKHYKTNDRFELIKAINLDMQIKYLDLPTKVDINEFSSGEKQIYVFCLYWALVKAANIEIPFIIDTPYARIDEAHRTSITNFYLPNISKQVIVLSTNKEIDDTYYRVIKDFVNKEYLLQYLDNERKTIVHNRYFYEV